MRRINARRSALLIAAGLLIVSGAGCTAGSDSPKDQLVIATYPGDGLTGDAAILEGTLSIAANCVYVESDGTRWLPVFPDESASISDGRLTLGAATFGDGDHIKFAGGATPDSSDATLPEACDPDTQIWTVSLL
jgi:hypothetical protein